MIENSITRKYQIYFLISASILFSSCTGESNNATNSLVGSTTTENLNRELEGYIWLSDSGSIFNLQSGETTKISDNNIYPSVNGQEFIEHIAEFRKEPGVNCLSADGDVERINFIDSKSCTITGGFEKLASIYNPIMLSPDGTSIVGHQQ